MFRSLLVPLTATGGFVLSLFADVGVHRRRLPVGLARRGLRRAQHRPDPQLPAVILVGILFGLAMDYQLFLVSGMREAYVHGSPARLAVAQGLPRGPLGRDRGGDHHDLGVRRVHLLATRRMIRSIGFGLAFGVLLDAFVVRMLLIPALMHLLGRLGLVAAALARPDPARTSTSRARRSSATTPGMQVGGVAAHRVADLTLHHREGGYASHETTLSAFGVGAVAFARPDRQLDADCARRSWP